MVVDDGGGGGGGGGIATEFMLVKPIVSVVAEHHQKAGHEQHLDNVKVLCRESKMLSGNLRKSPALQSIGTVRGWGRELSKSAIRF